VDRDPLEFARSFWRAFNERDLTGLEDLFAEDYANHAALPGTPPGPLGQAQLMQRLWKAFPDGRFSIEHLAADGETVICVGTMQGTHDGELLGVAPTHREVQWRQCHLVRVGPDGKALDHRAIRDDAGLMRQMGVGQAPGVT
jgi:predicted ester cyclase